MRGKARVPFQLNPVEWRPDAAGFAETYGVPRETWDWYLRGVDPTVWQIEQEAQGPEQQRPLFFKVQVYADKFRRGKS